MGKDVIIACDFASAEETFKFLDKFEGKKPFVKIGMDKLLRQKQKASYPALQFQK